MSINRREFLHLLSLAASAGLLPASATAQNQDAGELYQIPTSHKAWVTIKSGRSRSSIGMSNEYNAF
jgi:hypothetical protein